MLPQLFAQIPIPAESQVHTKGDFWFPEQASTFASNIDFLYYAIFWISTIFFAGIVGVMCYFCWKYRRVGGVKGEIITEKSHSHNTALEIFWSVIPSVILVWIFYVGATGFFEMRVATDDAEEIHVKAQKWNWEFTYPNGDKTTELHLVLDKPVKLVMQSPDVLHSLFIPAFRQKMDIVPGRYSYAFVVPNRTGEFRLACTEYCGDEHSRMRTNCVVHESEELRKANTEWIRSENTFWENGERLYKLNCSGCHSVEGEVKTGPPLNLVWGAKREFVSGAPVEKADENYIRESILYPGNKIVAGYANQMQVFAGKLDDDDINDIIAFLKYKNDPDKYGADDSVTGMPGGEDSVGPSDAAPEAETPTADPEPTAPAN